MKRLFLLRHAQTMPANGFLDIERALTPSGQNDAQALGAVMRDKGYQPDIIFCSPARRTQQTLEHVMKSLTSCPVETVNDIYYGTHGDLIRLLQNNNEAHIGAILLIGHNPVIHELTATLAQKNPNSLTNRLVSGYAPGTLGVFDVSCEKWTNFHTGAATLVDLLAPGDYYR